MLLLCLPVINDNMKFSFKRVPRNCVSRLSPVLPLPLLSPMYRISLYTYTLLFFKWDAIFYTKSRLHYLPLKVIAKVLTICIFTYQFSQVSGVKFSSSSSFAFIWQHSAQFCLQHWCFRIWGLWPSLMFDMNYNNRYWKMWQDIIYIERQPELIPISDPLPLPYSVMVKKLLLFSHPMKKIIQLDI